MEQSFKMWAIKYGQWFIDDNQPPTLGYKSTQERVQLFDTRKIARHYKCIKVDQCIPYRKTKIVPVKVTVED